MKNSEIHTRMQFSLQGLRWAWRSERSLHDHALVSLALLSGLVWAEAQPLWIALVGLSIFAGWSLEITNAAIEALCDKLHPAHDPAIGKVKDMASAAAFTANMAMLLLTICALAVGR
ncbi:MAG: diacylglycerol kinase [Alphaproteobacteria bacterium]|nr:MAG: diacylglycerol kinase [Alphaproteobacteria bacterium]